MSDNEGLSLHPHLVSNEGSNNVYVVWVNNNIQNNIGGDILFKQSTDGGATFGDTINLSNNGELSLLPKIAASQDSNNVYVVWVDNNIQNNIGGDILFKRSTDGGATFGDTINLSNNKGCPTQLDKKLTAANPQVKVEKNNLYILWENYDISRTNGSLDQSGGIFIKVSNDTGNIFSNTVVLNLNTNQGESTNPQIAVSGNNVYVVWQDSRFEKTSSQFTSYDILFRRSNDAGGKYGMIVNLSSNQMASINPQIAVSGNNVYVVWQDSIPQGKQEIFFTKIQVPSTR